MLSNKKGKRERGFTIIEVLIVLAIAGLILLIILFTVPAMQRSTRNTQRKHDAASLLTGVNSYMTSNSNVQPLSLSTSGNDVIFCGASCASGSTENSKVGYYQTANVTLTGTVPGSFPDTNNITILTGYSCPQTTGTLPALAEVNNTSVVALFGLENGSSGQTNTCQEL
jgi:prepilin-type N-terminal cleavage/methylation domain-containing protein